MNADWLSLLHSLPVTSGQLLPEFKLLGALAVINHILLREISTANCHFREETYSGIIV